MSEVLRRSLGGFPLIAILRGLAPENALAVGGILAAAGFRIIEVPLNSPRPLDSIARLVASCGDDVIVGAGTVLHRSDVDAVRNAGGRLIVMPHGDPEIIEEAKRCGMICVPGVATPTEGFAALSAGGDALKMFPAEAMPPSVLKAWRAVFPKEALLIPVGGITPEKVAGYLAAGANGLGLGSALFDPNATPAEVEVRAGTFADSLRKNS